MSEIMLRSLIKYFFLAGSICLFAMATILENRLFHQHPEIHLMKDFQEKLFECEKDLDNQLEDISSIISSNDFDGSFFDALNKYTLLTDIAGKGFLVYQSGKLVYWSDRAISFNQLLRDYHGKFGLINFPNGYYFAKVKKAGTFDIVGLQLIKNNYSHENKYLRNSFYKIFRIPSDFALVEERLEGTYPMVDANGKFLFSFKAGNNNFLEYQLYLPAVFYVLGLILLLLYFKSEFFESKAGFFLKFIVMGAVLFLIYWLHVIFRVPALFNHLSYFNPGNFALNSFLPSLGDYFILILFISFLLYILTVNINVDSLSKGTTLSGKTLAIILLILSGGLFLLANFLIKILVYNSTISFELNKIIEINSQSLFGIFSVGLLLMSVISVHVKILSKASSYFSVKRLLLILVLVCIFWGIAVWVTKKEIPEESLLFLLFTGIFASLIVKGSRNIFSLNILVFFMFIASLYSLFIFNHTIDAKERENQKLFSVMLTAERDPAAEQFLSQIETEIKSDPAIQSLLIQKEDLREYVYRTYFSGYFKKYIFEMYVCSSVDSLIIDKENRTVPCRFFMDGMISDMGVRIAASNFYFMDDMNGRISYTGKFNYPLPNDPEGVTVFIDLDSDVLFEGIGFPELLIDKSITRSEIYRKFSYAKYFNGELTDKQGDFNYNLYIDNYEPEETEFSVKKMDGYEHLFYHVEQNNYIIVSRELDTFIDYLISFPYLFVFYFLMVLPFYIIGKKSYNPRKIKLNLQLKIQGAIISIVFFSLLLVALATILYNVREYKIKHQNDLNEKMKSVSEEIKSRLEDKAEITQPLIDWLSVELSRLSNIFQTDINIYSADGSLLVSSRPEIFQKGLVSAKMNSEAYFQIFSNFQYNNYFQPENIGKLSYLSVYKPIINNQGQPLGSINLPYFISQDKYSQEITTFIVAFINLYVMLLMLSIVIAVFISNQITYPLVLVQEKLRKIELGKHNEPIYYSGKDEIAGLVKEYNKKVEELAISAELLARSERESAWREMAKQIAHEIKNPLTPMKLNIQHLQQAKSRGKDYHEYIDRVTATLIEQIDNLSNIATEFSNFAQIPTARNQVFNLSEQLLKVISLFGSNEKAEIEFDNGNNKNIAVNADREQLSRAIINLIKNAMQAIPDNVEGKIKVALTLAKDNAIIAVSDNGTGIPVELRDKLFSPSFTTKTSGMGLGLAIVKNIAENFSGRVWFETEISAGSTFYLEIPVYKYEL